jgi:ParB/RepB/Spo0J family partition protein
VTAAVPTRSARNGKPSAAVAGEAFAEPGFGMVVSIALASIDIGDNVRVNIEAIDELATSIAEHGVLQPIKVRPHGERFEVVWGQRRVLASRKAGLERIPALITTTDQAIADRSIEQLIENLHRADLNPIDRAQAMRDVVESGVTQAELARQLGLAPSTIANDLGLLDAPAKVRELVEAGKITPSHAKALKGLEAKVQVDFAEQAVERGYSAHDVERSVQQWRSNEGWRREQEERSKAAAAEQEASTLRRLDELAKKLATDTPIYVGGGYYGNDKVGHVMGLVRRAGFTKVHDTKDTLQARPKGVCDCTAWKIEIGYSGGLTIGPACTNKKHTTAAFETQQSEDRAHREFQERVRDRVQALIAEQALELIHRSPEAARIFLWIAFDWSLNDWVRDHKGERKKPDAWDEICALPEGELAVELASFVRKGFGDRYNVKLDWPRLAAELGVEAPA